MRNKILLFGVCLAAAVVAAFGGGWSENVEAKAGDDSVKVIKFSHQKHINEFGVDCATCHAEAATSQLSSDTLTPGHAVCQTCHEEQVNKTCGYCHSDEKNPKGFAREARELRFNHKKHVTD